MAKDIDSLEELSWIEDGWSASPDDRTLYRVRKSRNDGMFYAYRLSVRSARTEDDIGIDTDSLGVHVDIEQAMTVCRDDYRWRML